MSFLHTLTHYRKLAGSIIFALVTIVALGMLAQCAVSVGNKDNWAKTTGRIGMSGEVRKNSASVSVFYKDPKTGEEKSANMQVGDEATAQALLDSGGDDETVYVYRNIVGTVTVCTESRWDDCHGRAQPKWWVFLIGLGLLAMALSDIRRRWRNAVGVRAPIGGTATATRDADD